MDQSIKTLINVTVLFIGLILMLSCLSFFIVATKARSALYAIVQHVEIYGPDDARIMDFAKSIDADVHVESIDLSPHEGNRFRIDLSFSHVFSWIQLKKQVTYGAYTRIVHY